MRWPKRSAPIWLRAPNTMDSDRRLHPSAPLFALSAQLRALLIPGLLALFAARSASSRWEVWAMILLVPYALYASVACRALRYRIASDRLVIRSGLLFRSERQIPFARIHNVDVVRGPLHRWLGVAEARLETGGSDEPEARLRVLAMDAVTELRARVQGPAIAHTSRLEPSPSLLELSDREVCLLGVIENRGGVLLAAALGLAYELNLLGKVFKRYFPSDDVVERAFRRASGTLRGGAGFSIGGVLYVCAMLLGFLLCLRLASVAMAWLRWGGFRLQQQAGDLHVRYGRLTRVEASLPRRRIQKLNVTQGWLQRLLSRVTIQVETAAVSAEEQTKTQRFDGRLAPLCRAAQASSIVHAALPAVDPTHADWQRLSAAALRRMHKRALRVCALVAAGALAAAWWQPRARLALALLTAGLFAFSWWSTRKEHRHFGFALSGGALWVRRGWLRRRLEILPLPKIQCVATRESPFDRRAGMASLHVDFAGGGLLDSGLPIRDLERARADELAARLSAHAAATSLTW